MQIVCARNMPLAGEAFSTLGQCTLLDGRKIRREDLQNTELLAIRSTTPTGADLLDGTPVRFVGTATIGTDHMDIPYLEEHGIQWCYSPGCNANSVSEYITAALLVLGVRHSIPLSGKTLGVIGVGNVGTRVAEKGRALGMHVLLNDPPRQRCEPDAGPFVSLEQLLAESDIVSLHVPLTHEGPDATAHMANADFFKAMRPGSIFLNAARGGAMNTEALLKALRSGHIAHCVIDTWEKEPDISQELLVQADIATPHIAGHSYEGKVQGTVMVYEAACRFLGIRPAWKAEPHMPPPTVPFLTLPPQGQSSEEALHSVVSAIYDICQDDQRLRAAGGHNPEAFDDLRKHYPMRREFRFTTVSIPPSTPNTVRAPLSALGFQIDAQSEHAEKGENP